MNYTKLRCVLKSYCIIVDAQIRTSTKDNNEKKNTGMKWNNQNQNTDDNIGGNHQPPQSHARDSARTNREHFIANCAVTR